MHSTKRNLYAVRYGNGWIKVQRDRDGGQYRTGRWFGPLTAAGLEYVLSGGGNARHRSIAGLLEEEGITGRRGARHDLEGFRAYEIEEEVP